MMHSVQVVAVCGVGMVSRLFLVTASLVLCRFFMMAGSMFMMRRRFLVVSALSLLITRELRIFGVCEGEASNVHCGAQ
jgi:hypothetical protein